jgi:hypothetical protein
MLLNGCREGFYRLTTWGRYAVIDKLQLPRLERTDIQSSVGIDRIEDCVSQSLVLSGVSGNTLASVMHRKM